MWVMAALMATRAASITAGSSTYVYNSGELCSAQLAQLWSTRHCLQQALKRRARHANTKEAYGEKIWRVGLPVENGISTKRAGQMMREGQEQDER